MQLFLDCEFTELTRHALLISIALYGDDERYFYAEFNDFDEGRLSEWIVQNVMNKLEFKAHHEFSEIQGDVVRMKGSSTAIVEALKAWMAQFEAIEIWGDVPHYDWLLFCDLFGGALEIPGNVHFICRDIATLFWLKKVDINISRIEFVGTREHTALAQHNALFDAYIMKSCFDKLLTLKYDW